MTTTGALAQDVNIAGLQPDRRPDQAPIVTAFEKGPDWLARALHGVSEPVPAGLGFLDDQGAWFTPFTHAGMPGRYDIRSWHREQ